MTPTLRFPSAAAWLALALGALSAEPFRPLYHFTPERNWMNDPNGMVFHDGEWHLFYQYNPFGDTWGHMSWGHAVSRNLLRWDHLPLALSEAEDVMIFSGSAVVDEQNTSGFGQDGKAPMVAIYTAHTRTNQSQALAFSNDHGRTWTKYFGNPVLDIGAKDFRDPKVRWYEPARRWVMTVAWPLEHKVRFYASSDLRTWSHLSDFGPAGAVTGIWECPDLFPLKVEGGGENWVLIVNLGSGGPAGGSAGQYFVGDFDGRTFTPHARSLPAGKPAVEPEGAILAGFENGYATWKATGDSFGDRPATGPFDGQHPVTGFKGKCLVNTFLGGDAAQGTLTSPEFRIANEWISFLVGGGAKPGKTCVNLKIGGKVMRTATGRESEALDWVSWNVAAFRGQMGQIEIVDAATDGWGHVNADHFMLGDEPAVPATEPALWLDYGPDFYAGVTWSGAPPGDDRRILLGWMSNWQYANAVPTTPWRSAMSVPRELSLRRCGEALRLVQWPVREMSGLTGVEHFFKTGSVAEANAWLRQENIAGDQMDFSLTLTPQTGAGCGLTVLAGDSTGVHITADPGRGVLTLDRLQSGLVDFHPTFARRSIAPLPAEKEAGAPVHLRVLVDACSVEVFAADGAVAATCLAFPRPQARPVQITSAAAVGPLGVRVFPKDPR